MIATKRRSCTTITALFLLLFISGAAVGDETEDHHSAESEHETHHPNVLAVFVGVAFEDRRDNGVALGLEYERRLSRVFGVGALVEHTFGDIDTTVYAVPFAFHHKRWKFVVAPGIEDGDHGSENLIRVGAEYAFEVRKWEIAPQFDLDFVDGDSVLVVGAAFGKGF